MTSYAAEDRDYLEKLIRGIRIVMMTTVCPNGTLRSRPMIVQNTPFDGTLWFFTSADPSEAGKGRDEGQINISYISAEENRYISISGLASLVFERQKIEELWNSSVEPWFPQGLTDPRLALLQVKAEKWEYWDSQAGLMVQYDGQLKSPSHEAAPEDKEQLKGDLNSRWVTQDVGTKKERIEARQDAGVERNKTA